MTSDYSRSVSIELSSNDGESAGCSSSPPSQRMDSASQLAPTNSGSRKGYFQVDSQPDSEYFLRIFIK